jgi:vacuolar-type H+-ATPase subunit C/Vma6
VQINIADPGAASAASPTGRTSRDMDYLAARLHGRKSRMAEAERLDSLCRIRGLQEFFHTVLPESQVSGALDFQRLLVYELAGELSGFRAYISGPGVDLIDWMLVRFQMENLKVLIRAFLTKVPIEDLDGYLVSLPGELTLDIRGLAAVEFPEGFVRLFPKKGILRENMEKALEIYRDNPRPFFFEAALDRSYFQGLIFRTEKLPGEDREIITPMVYQEVDIFHLMLAARGKFHYGLAPSMLQPFHVEGTGIKRSLFAAMLNDPDLYTSAGRVGERVFDAVPFEWGSGDGSNAVDAPVLEGLAWNRFFRLANLAFRRSHMGLGAIMGYAGLRRVEVANLITISEGIRGGIAAEKIRGRLIPRTDLLKVA